jgi:mono/diheme cytochrome c family protein
MLVVPQPAGAVGELCLRCHPAHYSERGDCTSCHRGNQSAGRKELAHHRLQRGRYLRYRSGELNVVQEGRELVDRFACRRCHTIDGRGNRLAADLDLVVPERTGDELSSALQKPAEGMPDFYLGESQRDRLINALYAAAQPKKSATSRPVLVHFRTAADREPDVFTRKCGPCHRAIVKGRGALGRGRSGPDLSGLLTPYYPATFGNGERWDRVRLERWLKNPRTVRAWSNMRPVAIDREESRELAALLCSGTLLSGSDDKVR